MKFLSLLVVAMMIAGCSGSVLPKGQKSMVGAGMPKAKADSVSVRQIILLHPQSGEKINVSYYHDGRYDDAAMKKINHIMRDRHDESEGPIDPELIDYLVDLRTRMGLPPSVVFEVLSGYRSEETNAVLASRNGQVAKESLHKQGWAVDFRIRDVNGHAIEEIAKTMQRGGVAYYPSDNHLHVDIGNIRTWVTR